MFSLEMHVDSATKASKTEAVFFPAPGFFKILSLPPSEASSSSLPLTENPKKESKKAYDHVRTYATITYRRRNPLSYQTAESTPYLDFQSVVERRKRLQREVGTIF